MKYNSFDVYVEQGTVDLLKQSLVEEVKIHLIQEAPEYEDIKDDEPAMKFIIGKINGILNNKLKLTKQEGK